MRIPKSINQLTVEKFQECDQINNNTSLDQLDKNLLLLSAITGKSIAYWESVPMFKLKVNIAKLGAMLNTSKSEKPKRFIMIGWRIYQSIQLASELHDLMSTDQFTAYSEYTKDNAIKNMHLVLPLMYCHWNPFRKPCIPKNQTKHSEVFKKAKIGDISGTAFFFKTQQQAFIPILEKLRDQSLQTIADHMQEVMTSGMVSEINTAGMTP